MPWHLRLDIPLWGYYSDLASCECFIKLFPATKLNPGVALPCLAPPLEILLQTLDVVGFDVDFCYSQCHQLGFMNFQVFAFLCASDKARPLSIKFLWYAFLSDYLTDLTLVTQHKINFIKNCHHWGLNQWPPNHQSHALPTNLGRNWLEISEVSFLLFHALLHLLDFIYF